MVEIERLTDVFGSDRVITDTVALGRYAQDQSCAPRSMPECAVLAKSVDEVQRLVRLANQTGTPLTPFSSGLNFHGAAVPHHGGVVVDLSAMNGIVEINEENWFVVIEPGVTYRQLQSELRQRGFRVMVPFGAAPGRSVLTSYLERDPVLAAASFELGNFLILDTELVLPDGELFRTGLWASGGPAGGAIGPVRNHIFRLWTGAQGTLGIMTKMGIHMTPLMEERRIFFLAFRDLSHAIEPLKRIQRRQIGTECFVLNRFNAAALLNNEWEMPESFPVRPVLSVGFDALRAQLPPWIVAVCINGGLRHPHEKVAYEERALRELCDCMDLALYGDLPGVPGQAMLDELLQPWGILKKFNYRGAVRSLCFKAPLQRVGALEAVMQRVCHEGGYSTSALGVYLLPMERGRAVHCEFDLHCDPGLPDECRCVKDAWLRAGRELADSGAYFDRPYGPWAGMVFDRAGTHTRKLQELKLELDPNGIMNPGKLCF